MTVLTPSTRVHFRSGRTLDVLQLSEDAARLLWGTEPGDDAHDMGYAALITSEGIHRVNPSEVERVEDISRT
jgi:hypothetical protein